MIRRLLRTAPTLVFACLLATPAVGLAFPGEITTYGGTGSGGDTGDGGLATAAKIQNPQGQALDANGHLFFADTDNHHVRRIDANTGIITTIAGDGSQGFGGDGGLATSAQLRFPHGVAVAANGDVFIADTQNHRIRRVDAATGVITTYAGTGSEGDSGDGGPATAAELDEPTGLAIDLSGRLTIADTDNHKIRRINAAGTISTIAGTGDSGYSGDDGPATTARLNHPEGIAYDIVGDLFIADTENDRIRKVNISLGTIRTVAGTGASGFSGDGGGATNAKLKKPTAVALDTLRHLYIGDTENHRVRRVQHGTGIITTIAGTGVGTYNGDGIAAVTASLKTPGGVAATSSGDVLISDAGNERIRRVEDPPFTECGDGTVEVGEECDDGNTTDGDCCSSSCTIEPAGSTCRAAVDLCDSPEACDGVTPSCPADSLYPNGTTCRAAAGLCDLPEVCDGASSSCPADLTEAPGTTCRAAADVCDVAETCTGAATCPADSFVPSGTECRGSAGGCDPAETCTGTGPSCPVDALHDASTVCRAAADLCDAIELCSGVDPTCPADGIHSAGTVCRSAAGVCDVAESCDGSSITCPSDALVPAGTECRASTDPGCDPAESCTGANAFCPGDYMEPDGTICDDGDPQTINESCVLGMCGCLGDDLDGDTIPDSCDLEDAPIEVSKLTARWGKIGKGLITGKGTFEIGPGDAFDVATGLLITVSDDTQPGYAQVAFLPAECGTSANGAIKCKTMDKTGIAKFKRKEIDDGVYEYKYSFRLKNLDLMTDLTAPVRVELAIGVIDRVGDIGFCFPKTKGLRCKQ